jgi:hypothetical protein
LQNDYIEQLLENKKLVDAIQGYKEDIQQGLEVHGHMNRTIKAQSGIIELYKKEKNPNRVTGGKRGRPKGSKSKAGVSFGADAMPDND